MKFNSQETPLSTSMINAQESLYREDNKIRTFTGKYVDIFNPKLEDFDIEDIAHALSMQCRFGGHLPVFYSVAQHCISCAMNAPDEFKFDALMHDASEAYLLDIPRPIKKSLTQYMEIENTLMQALSQAFNFNYPMSHEVKIIDEQALVFEWNRAKLKHLNLVEVDIMSHSQAKEQFINLFNTLQP